MVRYQFSNGDQAGDLNWDLVVNDRRQAIALLRSGSCGQTVEELSFLTGASSRLSDRQNSEFSTDRTPPILAQPISVIVLLGNLGVRGFILLVGECCPVCHSKQIFSGVRTVEMWSQKPRLILENLLMIALSVGIGGGNKFQSNNRWSVPSPSQISRMNYMFPTE